MSLDKQQAEQGSNEKKETQLFTTLHMLKALGLPKEGRLYKAIDEIKKVQTVQKKL